MNKILAVLFFLFPLSVQSHTYLGFEYGEFNFKKNSSEKKISGHSVGVNVYKRFLFDEKFLLDLGLGYSKSELDFTYKSGPFYFSEVNSKGLNIKLSPGFYFTKNIGVTIENRYFIDSQKIGLNETQRGSTGAGLFYEKDLGKDLKGKISVTYSKGWSNEKKNDLVSLEIAIAFGGEKNSPEKNKKEEKLVVSLIKGQSKPQLFPFDKYSLSQEVVDYLNRLAAIIQESEFEKIIVEGHADRRGSDEINDKISLKRAESVKNQLVIQGIDSGKIEVFGFGKRALIDEGNSRAAHLKNRRVIIKIEFNSKNVKNNRLMEFLSEK